MPLELQFEIANTPLTTWKGLEARLTLTNTTDSALEIPQPSYDQSGAFSLELYTRSGQLLRRMNALTSQAMMTMSRPSTEVSRAILEPGQRWEWPVDFCFHHYSLAPGDYEAQAVYSYPDGGINVRSGRRAFVVDGERLISLQAVRERPILDGLTLLFGVLKNGTVAYYLRQHSYDRPLAAWYAAPVLAGLEVKHAVIAPPNYFRRDKFDHFLGNWIIAVSAGRIDAVRYFYGKPTGELLSAELPPGRELVAAFSTADNRVFAFLRKTPNVLEACEVTAGNLGKIFERPLAGLSAALLSICADELYIHLVYPDRGIFHELLDHQGNTLEQRRLFDTRMTCQWLNYDPVSMSVKALFRDSLRGRMIQMASVPLDPKRAGWSKTLSLPFHGRLGEIAFDCSRGGRFHMLISTSRQRLYYLAENHEPALIAAGQSRFFPIVLARRRLYLGCYRANVGYRFLEFARRDWGQKILDYDAMSCNQIRSRGDSV